MGRPSTPDWKRSAKDNLKTILKLQKALGKAQATAEKVVALDDTSSNGDVQADRLSKQMDGVEDIAGNRSIYNA